MTLDRVRGKHSAPWKTCFCSCAPQHLPAGVGVTAWGFPQEAAGLSAPFAPWVGMCSPAAGIPLASACGEACPGTWPVCQDCSRACYGTDPPGRTCGRTSACELRASPPPARRARGRPARHFFPEYLPAPGPVWVSGENRYNYKTALTLGRNRLVRQKGD